MHITIIVTGDIFFFEHFLILTNIFSSCHSWCYHQMTPNKIIFRAILALTIPSHTQMLHCFRSIIIQSSLDVICHINQIFILKKSITDPCVADKKQKYLIKTNHHTHSEDDEFSTVYSYDEDDADEDDDCWIHCQLQPQVMSRSQDWSLLRVTGSQDSQRGAASHGQRKRMIGWGWWRRCCQSQWSVVVGGLGPCVNNTPQGLTTHIDRSHQGKNNGLC